MSMDIQGLFNQRIPAAFAANAAAAKQIGVKFQWTISGPNGGVWIVDTSASGPSVMTGAGNADCVISISDEDFTVYYQNPQANGTQLFFAGKIKISGDQMLLMKFPQVLTLGS